MRLLMLSVVQAAYKAGRNGRAVDCGIDGVQGWLSSGLDVFPKALAFNTGSGYVRCITGLAKDVTA